MDFIPDPGNAIDDIDFNYRVLSGAFADGKPIRVDLGGLSIFEALGVNRAIGRLLEDAAMDFVECDELDFEDDEDD